MSHVFQKKNYIGASNAHWLQKDRKIQRSLGSAGAGAGRAAMARADAKVSEHAIGRGVIVCVASHESQSSAVK
jgi:hypothetical protein